MKLFTFLVLSLTALLFGPSAEFAIASTPYCDLAMEENSICLIAVYDLHPTQKAVGMRQIESGVSEIEKMSNAQLNRFISEEKIPVIAGPDGNFYMTDRHHFVLSLHTARGRRLPSLVAKVKKNWSMMSEQKFWQQMQRNNYIYLYDEHGSPLSDHTEIPDHITELKNDPYRSLAWAVRELGGFKKTDIPFAEFAWANYFRPLVDVGISDSEFDKAVSKAMQLAKSKSAKHLPGYKS